MLEDGFKSNKYSEILANLRDNGFLEKEDIENLLKKFMTTQKITLDCVNAEKAKIVSEALMDNYKRQKFK